MGPHIQLGSRCPGINNPQAIGRRQLRLTTMHPHPCRAAPEHGAWNAYRYWEAAASADYYASAPQSGSPRTWCMKCLQISGGGSFG